ncbi:uncharacterized protein LAJ45_04223 [Morchella importuna]|uniref:uncharacterized protein n=1 Tax=Morchella importuna TaxID=1174673 RepID=UPI001E8CF74E|nr:uncharacterized protein LAJ45_04223 [Morchella importuna]KAH8151601.1 hypothetical protein LAJ45_04223 [Morchella importuna]
MVIASLGSTDAIHMVPQFFGHDNQSQRYHTQHLWCCLILVITDYGHRLAQYIYHILQIHRGSSTNTLGKVTIEG